MQGQIKPTVVQNMIGKQDRSNATVSVDSRRDSPSECNQVNVHLLEKLSSHAELIQQEQMP